MIAQRVAPRRRRPPADPFAPLSEQAIRSRATADVRSQVDPILKQITSGIESRTRAGSNAISGYTSTLADRLGAGVGKVQDIYGGAQQSQAAVEEALASRLSGQGNQLSGELSAKLAQIGAPGSQVQDVAGGAAQMGQGLAGASYGHGSASLSRLIQEGAAEGALAQKQPGIARLGGLQQLGTLQRQSQADLAEQTGEVNSRVPGLIQQLLGDYRQNELSKAGAREDRRISNRDFAFDQRVFEEGVLGDRGKMKFEAQQAAAERQHESAMARAEFQRDMAKSTVQYQREMAAAEKAWQRSKQDDAAARAFEARQAQIERRQQERRDKLERKHQSAERAKDRGAYGAGGGKGKSTGLVP